MPKNILIVESDSALSRSMADELQSRGFTVQETSDTKGTVDRMRQSQPDLVILAVGQNGYLLCGKIKKDDDVKNIPLVIVGNKDGFAGHRKLKTHADDYVALPVDLDALVQSVGNLIGLPETTATDAGESVSFTDLVGDGDDATGEYPAEEISVVSDDGTTVAGDPELDMLDAAFADATGTDAPPPPVDSDDEEVHALDSFTEDGEDVPLSAEISIDTAEEEDSADQTLVGFVPPELGNDELVRAQTFSPEPRPPSSGASHGGPDAAELRTLRSRVAELERAAQDAEERATEALERARTLEDEVSAKANELEAARATHSGKTDKDVFALRDSVNKKDKEILRLKSEANEKDNEIVELRDKVLQLEQEMSEQSGETARKDAQIKTLTQKTEQLATERKRFDQQLLVAKEEARTATANLSTVQSELDELRSQLSSAHTELDEQRLRSGDLESQVRQARDEAAEIRADAAGIRDQLDSARREADEARGQLEQMQMDLDAANNQISAQATAFADEASTLRNRISELEDAAHKHEERITRFYGKIKEDEKVREKTRKALAIALQLLDEQQQARMDVDVEVDIDEPAEA